MATEKTEQFGVRATPEELKMLEELAAKEERTVSDVVRRLIRKAHSEAFPSKKPKK